MSSNTEPEESAATEQEPQVRAVPRVPGMGIPIETDTFARSVSSELGRDEYRRVRRHEDRRLRIEDLPDFRPLLTSELLVQPDDRPAIVIGSTYTGTILRSGHTARLLADAKAGKTTVALDFLRASITGEPFLGFFPVEPIADDEYVGWVDPELGLDWKDYVRLAFHDCPPETVDRLRRIDTQGLGVDMMSGPDADWLTEQLTGCSRVVFDSVSDLFSGNPNDAGDVRDLFNAWEVIKLKAGIREAIWVVHMNRARDERSFGSQKWDARFNSLWSLLKEGDGGFEAQAEVGVDDSDLGRFFKVVPGRHTAFAETPIGLDEHGRPTLDKDRLGTTRKKARKEKKERAVQEYDVKVQGAILAFLRNHYEDAENPPLSKNAIWKKLQDKTTRSRPTFLRDIDEMVDQGILTLEIGINNSHIIKLSADGQGVANLLPDSAMREINAGHRGATGESDDNVVETEAATADEHETVQDVGADAAVVSEPEPEPEPEPIVTSEPEPTPEPEPPSQGNSYPPVPY